MEHSEQDIGTKKDLYRIQTAKENLRAATIFNVFFFNNPI